MKIIYKLTLGFLLVSSLVGAVAYFGISASDSIHNAHYAVEEETIPVIKTLDDMKHAGMVVMTATHEYIYILSENGTESALLEAEYERIASGKEFYASSFKRYEGLVNKFFPEEKESLENIRIAGQKLQNTSSELIELKKQEVSGLKVQEKHEELEEAGRDFFKAVDDALAHEDKEFAERMDNLRSSIENTKKIILIVSLFTFIAAITSGIYLSSRFSKPILELKNAAVAIGKGKLDTRVEIKSSDEVGILATCFNQMADRLEQDIAERKRVEEALRESEEKYRALMNDAGDAILLADTEGNLVEVNKKAEELLGYTKKEFLNMHLTRIHPKEELDRTIAAFKEMLQKGSGFLSDGVILRKDGKTVPVDITGNVIRYKDKILMQGIFRDISERKKTEELRFENERLLYADRVKSEFLSKMSHELRTPLNAIMGFSELLKTTEELNEKQRHYIDNIYESGEHLLNIVSGILDMVQAESGREIKLVINRFSVSEAIEESLNSIKNKAAERNVVIKKELDPQLDFIEADEMRFRQVLFNLLDNAVKFSKPEGGVVTVAAKKEDNMARFSVSDTGIGIKEEDLGKLFQNFEQLESGTTRKYGGTGLGLAISKKLVELHGGEIRAESRFGEGSTFTFALPLKADKTEETK